ncbi:hypothetical protein ACXGQW_07540 [Wenyingzhuangia sp. IMCC45533]
MQKKLEAELMSLAHDILKLKRGDDVKVLKDKAYEVYEKLAVLTFIEKYIEETPLNRKTKEELIEETFETQEAENVDDGLGETKNHEIIEEITIESVPAEPEEIEVALKESKPMVEEKTPEKTTYDEAEDLFSKIESDEVKTKENDVTDELKSSLEQEFGSTVSLDVATDIFENAERVVPKKSINDAIMQQKNLQIDLNDRIAFVKNLFENSQEDFNRVISQLNTMSTEKEALSLIRMIKKEYNWNGKEVFEERLLMLIERKFN